MRTIEQIPKEIKNKISKIGTKYLLKKYQEGKFEGDELLAAQFYLGKRGQLIEKKIEVQRSENNFPIMKLTNEEFLLFEKIKLIVKENLNDKFQIKEIISKDENLKKIKGVLGSLRKKEIIKYNEEIFWINQSIGEEMINGKLPYKRKEKHETNFFRNQRITKEVDGKIYEKSAYVRKLLRDNKRITYKEISEELEKIGFPKLYHSELQRCKAQLGIIKEKEEI